MSYIDFECPYCGNKIRVLLSNETVSFGGHLGPIGASFSMSNASKTFSSYDVKCDFCGRHYYYFDIAGGFSAIKHFIKFKKQVIEWLKKNEIEVADLPNIVVGIVEPKGGVFKEWKRRLKRKFRRPVSDRFLEIVFEVNIDGVPKRGILHGRVYEVRGTQVISHIVLEYATWIGYLGENR